MVPYCLIYSFPVVLWSLDHSSHSSLSHSSGVVGTIQGRSGTRLICIDRAIIIDITPSNKVVLPLIFTIFISMKYSAVPYLSSLNIRYCSHSITVRDEEQQSLLLRELISNSKANLMRIRSRNYLAIGWWLLRVLSMGFYHSLSRLMYLYSHGWYSH